LRHRHKAFLPANRLGNPKVHDLHPVAFHNHNVVGLEVTVNNPQLVRHIQR
jgi:hypothetical protein